MKPTISKPFKSNDRTFDKVYNAFDKRDYFNSKGLAKVQIGNFERALKKNDKGAQQVLDLFKGDEKKAKDYITQVVSDRNKERAFNNYKAFKAAVDSIQKGKPQYGAVDYVKRIIHNNNQKYSIALYSTLRNKKFTKWKDVHNDIDSLIGESVNELSDKDIKKAEQIRKYMPGIVGMKFAKKASNEDILAYADLHDKYAEIYNSEIKPIRDAQKKLYRKYRLTFKESVNEGQKRYNQKDGVGKSKYVISYHDGKKKHKDGSDFFDIQIFRNKKDLAKFVNTLHKGGYKYGFDESEDGVPQGYNPMVESKTKESKVIQKIHKYTRTEKKFYDELAKHEVRIGQRDYAKFIIMALKGFGINPRQYKRIPDAEEKLYQTVSQK